MPNSDEHLDALPARLVKLAKAMAAANLRILADALEDPKPPQPAAAAVVRDPNSTTASTATVAPVVRYKRLGFGPPPRDIC